MLEDWGELIGLKGSGSNSVVIDEAFFPAHHTAPLAQLMGEWPMTTELLPGAEIHGNPMYSGGFMGFAIAELTTVQVGAARAMLDEYEALLDSTPIVSMSGNVQTRRYTDHDFQRSFGMALGWVDGAHGIMMRAGEIYGGLRSVSRRSANAAILARPLRLPLELGPSIRFPVQGCHASPIRHPHRQVLTWRP